MDEGNGTREFVIDKRADEAQRQALDRVLKEGSGDVLQEIIKGVCPNTAETRYLPFEWEFDLATRTGRMKAGEILETEVETLRGFGDPPPPYEILVTIPGGFEYAASGNSAETAIATKLRSASATPYEHANVHSSMARVRRGAGIGAGT